jgi:NlpE C-terminal OB domain
LPRSSRWFGAALAAVLLLTACAQQPAPKEAPEPPPPAALPPLPATFVDEADCPGCLAVTLTLRPDGAYLLRDQLGASEFYDFGRWRYAAGTLELAGDRDTRRYQLKELRKASQVEQLRGPFRMVGVYDGASFRECRTGVAWKLADTRAAQALKDEIVKAQGNPVLVALDAQLEGVPEVLRVFRPPSVLDARGCPG